MSSPFLSAPRQTALAWRFALAMAFACLALIGLAPAASAHTDLDSTSPADDSTVSSSVDEVGLTFTLPVTQLGEGVMLEGPDGAVPLEVASADEGVTWSATPASDLSPGAYAASWSFAAQDGHPLEGEFDFVVDGAGAESEAVAADTADATSEPMEMTTEAPSASADEGFDATPVGEFTARLGETLALWGGLVAAGGLAFAAFVLRGVDRVDVPTVLRTVRWSAVLILLGLVVRLAGRSIVVSQGDLLAPLSPQWWSDALAGPTGLVFGLQALGALALFVGAKFVGPGSARGFAAVAVAGASMVGAGHLLGGHSNTIEPRWLVIGADIAHLAAAAVWLGGVVIISVLLRQRRRDGRPLAAARLGNSFSVLAAASLVVVGVAGVVLTVAILDRPQQLWESSWGIFLLVKVAFVALVAAIGGYNHYHVVPAMSARHRGDTTPEQGNELLRQSATRETIIMGVIVILTAWLTASSMVM